MDCSKDYGQAYAFVFKYWENIVICISRFMIKRRYMITKLHFKIILTLNEETVIICLRCIWSLNFSMHCDINSYRYLSNIFLLQYMYMIISLCMNCNLHILTKNVPVIIPVCRTLLELILISISHDKQDVPGETPLETLFNFHFPTGLHSLLCCIQSRNIRSITQVYYSCNSLCVGKFKNNIINNITKNNIYSTVQRDMYVCVHKMNCIDNIDYKCYIYIFIIKVLQHIAFIYSKLTNNIIMFLSYYSCCISFFHWHDHGHTSVAIFLYLTDAFS